jgi:hypothetical protein
MIGTARSLLIAVSFQEAQRMHLIRYKNFHKVTPVDVAEAMEKAVRDGYTGYCIGF